jgi:hypothetical protein
MEKRGNKKNVMNEKKEIRDKDEEIISHSISKLFSTGNNEPHSTWFM